MSRFLTFFIAIFVPVAFIGILDTIDMINVRGHFKGLKQLQTNATKSDALAIIVPDNTASPCNELCTRFMNCTEWIACRLRFPEECHGLVIVCHEGTGADHSYKAVLNLEAPMRRRYIQHRFSTPILHEIIGALLFFFALFLIVNTVFWFFPGKNASKQQKIKMVIFRPCQKCGNMKQTLVFAGKNKTSVSLDKNLACGKDDNRTWTEVEMKPKTGDVNNV